MNKKKIPFIHFMGGFYSLFSVESAIEDRILAYGKHYAWKIPTWRKEIVENKVEYIRYRMRVGLS